jgi:protein-L-isoaspartate(D-aspartate) O-methyltransferase
MLRRMTHIHADADADADEQEAQAMLARQRRFFAEEVQTICNLKTARLVEAFATVPREQFLPPGPWLIRGEGDLMGAARVTPNADPRHIHHNVVVAIDPARQLFNGMPSAIGTWIDALALQPGDRVLHVGCGLGYYTALIAHCVGETGRVVAVDVDDALAAQARVNLAALAGAYGHVEMRRGDGATVDGERFDAILVNAGMTHPHEAWLAALQAGGRLLLPLTCAFPQMGPTIGKGLVLLLTDRGETGHGDNSLTARLLAFVAIYSALGIRDRSLEEALGKAMAKSPWPAIKRLRRDVHEPSASCWLHADTFCISLD